MPQAALATITEPIQVFVREDGSGTTEIFKKALNEFTSVGWVECRGAGWRGMN